MDPSGPPFPSTVSQLREQWSNPSDVLSLLLIIGGDIVQKALSQGTPGHFSPVCFSFGWVAYSFTALVSVIGDGRLLPPPDFPVKVFNLETGYVRENKNWVIGRILRDNEVFMNKRKALKHAGIRISVYTAEAPEKARPLTHWSERIWVVVTAIQLAVSVVPWGLYGEWGVFLVTMSGVMTAFITGQLPQWEVEKLSQKRKSGKYIALTSGNGSRDIMIIYSTGEALDLEQLATNESPRSDRVWAKSRLFSRMDKQMDNTEPLEKSEVVKGTGRTGNIHTVFMYKGLPVGLWFTRIVCFLQALFWIVLLITVAGFRSRSWYLVGVGGLGMLQNAVVAAVYRSPDRRGIPLTLVDTIVAHKVMDGLMDLDCTINGAGESLLTEFFPGSLRPDEYAWWSGNMEKYDAHRKTDKSRGRPRSQLRKRNSGIPDIKPGHIVKSDKRTSSSGTFYSNEEARPMVPKTLASVHEKNHSPHAAMEHMELENSLPPRRFSYREHSPDSVISLDWA